RCSQPVGVADVFNGTWFVSWCGRAGPAQQTLIQNQTHPVSKAHKSCDYCNIDRGADVSGGAGGKTDRPVCRGHRGQDVDHNKHSEEEGAGPEVGLPAPRYASLGPRRGAPQVVE
ncbi:hypothetical protein KUCAC02_003334, partial [Chaenocephalus aceratus]